MEEVLKIIDKHLADNLLDSYNPIRLLETIRAEIVNLGQFEQQVKPTLAGVEETDCNDCIYLDVTNNKWVCEIKGNIDIELEKDCKEYVRE